MVRKSNNVLTQPTFSMPRSPISCLQLFVYFIAAAIIGFSAPAADAATKKKPAASSFKKANVGKRAKAVSVPDLDRDGAPNLLSHAALVFDQTTGKTIYTKNADTPVPIASITKLMTAMVVLDAKLDLDEAVVIDAADVDVIKASRSRLPVGTAFRREDLMRLALMASDNRAAASLARTYPGGTEAFVAAMNNKAKALGLTASRFVDATGLLPGNVASPHDLAMMVSAASSYAQIRDFSTTPALHVKLAETGHEMGFINTNALVRSDGWNIGLSKTGFINEAGKCLVMQATINSKPVVIVLLDSWGRYTRMGDANRIKKWLESGKVALAPAVVAAKRV
jgi:serine-type D-Ala-D-Ala endopeptidase (penicillin-binding protein 7)